MKKNVTILIGLVVIVAVLYVGNSFMSKGGSASGKNEDDKTSVAMKSFVGQVVRVYEGDNVLEYGFDIPETATTTIDMDGALIRVIDQDAPLATMYMSYEGARGYSPVDYINNVIAPHVAVIDLTSTSTIGANVWQGAESSASEWHVASVLDGKWLIIVENKKSVKDTADQMLESVNAK
jgi:hypothetical protein